MVEGYCGLRGFADRPIGPDPNDMQQAEKNTHKKLKERRRSDNMSTAV